MTHNLEWRDVRSLFETLGRVEEEHNGNLKVTLGGQSVVFHAPSYAETATTEEVSQIRRLLKASEAHDAGDAGLNVLMVIDHEEARIFRTADKGSVPEQVEHDDSDGLKSRVRSAHPQPGQSEQTNYDAYYAEVAKSLADADKILIFGSGTGTSSAMDTFVTWVKKHAPNMSDKIVGAIVVDQSHMSEGQLLAKAREFYGIKS